MLWYSRQHFEYDRKFLHGILACKQLPLVSVNNTVMDQLDQEQQKIKKMSTNHIRAKLINMDYCKEIVYAADRHGLVELMAEHILQLWAVLQSNLS